MEIIRSLLFVPGTREKFIQKAPTVPADVICLDLEDSVPPAEKANAREMVKSFIPQMPRTGYRMYVRVNGLATGLLEEDLDAVVSPLLDGISLPKTDSSATIKQVDAYLTFLEKIRGVPQGQVKIIPWIETAMGVMNVYQILTASPRVMAASFGGEDYTTDMGIQRTPGSKEIEYGRYVVATACVAANVIPIDTPEPDLANIKHLEEEASFAKSIGYRGKCCIHPTQVEIVNRIFQPSEEEIEHAGRVVKAYEEGERQGLGAISLDGVMVDRPIVERARRLLEQVEQIKARGGR